jgi:hypothetical protein
MLLICQIGICFVGSPAALAGKVDFRAYYAAGYIVRTGDSLHLYDYGVEKNIQNRIVSPRQAALPFLYPAYASLLFVPLSLLSYKGAYFTFLAFNLLLLLSSALVMRKHLPLLAAVWQPLPWMLFLCLYPVPIALMQGQISFLLLLLYCGAFEMLQRGRPFLGGLVLSLALFKFQIALPVAFLFFVWRRWKFIGGFAIGALIVATLSVYVTGVDGLVTYWHSMSSMTAQITIDARAAKAHYGMFPTEMPNLHGVFYALSHGARWGQILTGFCSVLLMLWAAIHRASLPLALGTGMLVSYHMPPHDLILLLLPLSLGLNAMLSGFGEALSRRSDTTAKDDHIASIGPSPLRDKMPPRLLVAGVLLMTILIHPVLMLLGLGYTLCFSAAAITLYAAREDLIAAEGFGGSSLV